MFNLLFQKYKLYVLRNDLWKDIKSLMWYEKLSLLLVFIGLIGYVICDSVKCQIGSRISIVVVVLFFMIIIINQAKHKEKERVLNTIVEPAATERMRKVIKLLKEFDVDINDGEQLENLISLAQKQQEEYDFLSKVKINYGGGVTCILVTIVTVFITEWFKNLDWKMLLYRTLLSVFVLFIIVSILSVVTICKDDIFNADKRKMQCFIRDIEDIKMFKSKATRICGENNNQ